MIGGRDVVFEGLAHVQLPVPPGSEDEARAFYRDLLGWPEIEKPPSLAGRGGCWFRCGAHEVHLGVDPDVVRGRHHPAIIVRGLDALQARLVDGDARVEVDRQIPGFRRFYAYDPFGNRIEFLESDPQVASR